MLRSLRWLAALVFIAWCPTLSFAAPASGEPSAPAELPAAATPDWEALRSALILWVDKPTRSEICTGVAVDRRIVLTAAHCLDGAKAVKASYGREPVVEPEYSIMGARWSIHPGYDRSRSFFINDLGVLELSEPLPEEIPIAAIASAAQIRSAGIRLERVGFGRRNGLIRRTWTDPVYRGVASGRAIVSYDRHAVPGDSGGPIFARIDGKLRLVGIHSTLQKNGRALSVSVVPVLADWLALRATGAGSGAR